MPTQKKPGILGWILYAIAVIAGLAIISSIFQAITGNRPVPLANQTTIGRGSMGMVESYAESGLMALPPGEPAIMKSMDAMLDSEPALPPFMGGGSANRDLEGNIPKPRVIRNAELDLHVENAGQALDDASKIVKDAQGFIEQSSMSDTGTGPRTAYMTLRIPAASFDEVLGKLKRLAVVVLDERTNAQDITAQFVDLEARLKNAQAEEQSYVAILNRAGSIEDVLQVTRQLADVRGRIEQMQAQRRYLENQTDLATIQLTLTEKTRVEIPSRVWRPGEVLRQAFQELVLSLQGFVDFLIRFAIALVGLLIPITAFVALVLWLGWKLVKRVLARFK